MTPTEQTSTETPSTRKRTVLLWTAFLVPIAALVVAIAFSVTGELPDSEAGSPAPSFALTATDGGVVTLSDVIAEGDALLYFSMGPGCDGCFAQIPEIEDRLADRGIRLVPIMVAPPSLVDPSARRFGIETPILIDSDRSVSEAYEMLGIYGHANTPSHSFALVGSDGRINWIGHFAEMYIPFEVLWGHIEDEAL